MSDEPATISECLEGSRSDVRPVIDCCSDRVTIREMVTFVHPACRSGKSPQDVVEERAREVLLRQQRKGWKAWNHSKHSFHSREASTVLGVTVLSEEEHELAQASH